MKTKLFFTSILNICAMIAVQVGAHDLIPLTLDEEIEPATQANRPGDNGGGIASEAKQIASLQLDNEDQED